MKKLYTFRFMAAFAIFALYTPHSFAQGIISTIAGTGVGGYSGDGGPAVSAQVNNPNGIRLNNAGNILIADAANNRIRKIDAGTGIISTIAGTGTAGFGGDGGLATMAQINAPFEMFVTSAGDIYFSDHTNNRIRKIDANTGIINTVAGIGSAGFSGDGGPALSAELRSPTGICQDNNNNIYICDYGNNRIRKIDAVTGVITTIAGGATAGFAGDGGPAVNAELNGPQGLGLDNVDNIYFTDHSNYRVRKIDKISGIITTVAGNGTLGSTNDGNLATSAAVAAINLFIDNANNIYLCDALTTFVSKIRKVDAVTGIISTVAGISTSGYSGDGGPATSAQLNKPFGVCIDVTGNMYISEFSSKRIRKVSSTTGIDNISTAQFNMRPNPSGGKFTIAANQNLRDCDVTIYNLSGQKVYQATITGTQMEIDLSNSPKGIYFLCLRSKTNTVTKELIIK